MKKVVLAVLLLCGALFAEDAGAVYKAKCASCHGADAKTKYMNKVPPLAGQDKAKLAESMKGYLAGTKNSYGVGAVMAPQAKLNLKSDAEIEAMAKYLSALK